MRDGREHDLEEIRRQHAQTRDPRKRRELEEIGRDLARQRSDGKIASMRESLIREMRAGRVDNVKDISEEVKKDPRYQ